MAIEPADMHNEAHQQPRPPARPIPESYWVLPGRLLAGEYPGARDQGVGQAMGYGRQRAHGAGKNDHSVGRMAAAGDRGADVSVGMLDDFAGFAGE